MFVCAQVIYILGVMEYALINRSNKTAIKQQQHTICTRNSDIFQNTQKKQFTLIFLHFHNGNVYMSLDFFFSCVVVYISHARSAIYRNGKVIAFCIHIYVCWQFDTTHERKIAKQKKIYIWKIIFLFKWLGVESALHSRKTKTSFVIISHNGMDLSRILDEKWKIRTNPFFIAAWKIGNWNEIRPGKKNIMQLKNVFYVCASFW